MRGALFEMSGTCEWHHRLTLFVNCISRRGDESAPLASATQSSMSYFPFESAGFVKYEPMQNAPSVSPTSVRGFQSACGARISCSSESPSPVARNTRKSVVVQRRSETAISVALKPTYVANDIREAVCLFGSFEGRARSARRAAYLVH